MDSNLLDRTILLCLAGSRAHGLHGEGSDVDLRGIAVPPEAVLLGFRETFDQADRAEDMVVFADLLTPDERRVVADTKLEGSVFALAKFARLAADCNPNILEALFCRDEEVRLATDVGRRLRAARHRFLSVKALHTFTGYALSQLKRIQGHRAWLLHPPKGPPARADFGLPERTLLPKDQLAAAQAAVQKKLDEWNPDWGPLPASEIQRLQDALASYLGEVLAVGESTWHRAGRAVGLDDNLIAAMERERAYKAAQRNWLQYRTWREERNPERAALEGVYGYDTKHGAHLVRLLRMGREILESGDVFVWRGDRDADELRAIRGGAWPYERLLSWAESEAHALREFVRQGRAVVPPQPDLDALDALVVDITRQFLAGVR